LVIIIHPVHYQLHVANPVLNVNNIMQWRPIADGEVNSIMTRVPELIVYGYIRCALIIPPAAGIFSHALNQYYSLGPVGSSFIRLLH